MLVPRALGRVAILERHLGLVLAGQSDPDVTVSVLLGRRVADVVGGRLLLVVGGTRARDEQEERLDTRLPDRLEVEVRLERPHRLVAQRLREPHELLLPLGARVAPRPRQRRATTSEAASCCGCGSSSASRCSANRKSCWPAALRRRHLSEQPAVAACCASTLEENAVGEREPLLEPLLAVDEVVPSPFGRPRAPARGSALAAPLQRDRARAAGRPCSRGLAGSSAEA